MRVRRWVDEQGGEQSLSKISAKVIFRTVRHRLARSGRPGLPRRSEQSTRLSYAQSPNKPEANAARLLHRWLAETSKDAERQWYDAVKRATGFGVRLAVELPCRCRLSSGWLASSEVCSGSSIWACCLQSY